MSILTQEYNSLLKRFWKAYTYLENKEIPEEEKQKWIPDYLKIVKRLSAILIELRKHGEKPTHEQILEGL